jgi:hypothetical protein
MRATLSVLLCVILLGAGSSAEADHPTSDDGPTLLHWQCACSDGRKTPVHVTPHYVHGRRWSPFNGKHESCNTSADCTVTNEECHEWDGENLCLRFLPFNPEPRAPEGTYNTRFCDEFCAPGDVVDAGGNWVGIGKSRGWYHGDDSPAFPADHPLEGPDAVTCNCLGSETVACFDHAGPKFVPPEYERFTSQTSAACHAACARRHGAFMSGFVGGIRHDSPECDGVTEPPDRGPEIHCVCNGQPEGNTWCTDDPRECTDRGCEVHHTAPVSTRCLETDGTVPPTCPLRCTIGAALEELICAVNGG